MSINITHDQPLADESEDSFLRLVPRTLHTLSVLIVLIAVQILRGGRRSSVSDRHGSFQFHSSGPARGSLRASDIFQGNRALNEKRNEGCPQ